MFLFVCCFFCLQSGMCVWEKGGNTCVARNDSIEYEICYYVEIHGWLNANPLCEFDAKQEKNPARNKNACWYIHKWFIEIHSISSEFLFLSLIIFWALNSLRVCFSWTCLYLLSSRFHISLSLSLIRSPTILKNGNCTSTSSLMRINTVYKKELSIKCAKKNVLMRCLSSVITLCVCACKSELLSYSLLFVVVFVVESALQFKFLSNNTTTTAIVVLWICREFAILLHN